MSGRHPEFKANSPKEPDHLTPRMIQVGKMLVDGLRNKEIAEKLGSTEGAIKQNLRLIKKVLNMKNRTQIAVWFSKTMTNNIGVLILLMLAGVASAQNITVTGPATAVAGVPVTANFTLTNNATDGAGIAAFQLAINTSNGTFVVGPAALSVGKTITCKQSTTLTCVVYANNNATNIPNGVVGSLTFTPTVSGNITLTALFGASATGSSRTVTAGAPYSFTVSGPVNACDINGDGVVNFADVDLIAQQVTTANPSIGPTVVNLIRVYLASIGQPCQ